MNAPRVALLTTGTELLRGRAVDTHPGLIGRALEPLGLQVDFHASCPDDLARIVDEIRLASARAEIVIVTGGLGPTEDDYTRRAAAEAFGRPLEFDPASWAAIRARFRKFRIPIAAVNRRQAFFPRGARPLANPNGSAPGFEIRSGARSFFALPGPPREMVPMLEGPVLRRLAAATRGRRRFRVWESKVYGMPEGDVDMILKRVVDRHPGATYGLSVSGGMVSLFVKSPGSPAGVARALKRELGIRLVGPGTLAETVAELLLARGQTIAAAESCTGGLLLGQLTNVPGVSRALLEGWICYSNASKVARLGVPAAMIQRHGAVSEEVAAAMAEGAALIAGADVGVATTGIAGPAGGSSSKPVGLVWHAVRYRGRTRAESRVFPGGRQQVRERATNFALDLVRRALLGGGSK